MKVEVGMRLVRKDGPLRGSVGVVTAVEPMLVTVKYDPTTKWGGPTQKYTLDEIDSIFDVVQDDSLLHEVVAYLEPRVGHIPSSRGYALLQKVKGELK